MKLVDYTWEIYEIAKKQDKDIGVARDMFIANMENAGDETLPYYEGADDVDYIALGKEWCAMTAQEQWDEKNLYKTVTRGNRAQLAKYRAANDRKGFDAVIAQAVEEEVASAE